MMKNVTALVKSFLREPYLFRVVKSLKDLYPDIHVLVADDGYVSDVKEAKLKAMGVEGYIRLPYASCGITKGRNLLVDACETEYCLIGDDDFLYTEDSHLEFLLKLMEVADIAGGAVMQGGIFGHYEGFYRHTPEGVTFRDIDRTYSSRHSGIEYSPADFIFNFFIAKTETLRRVRWDEQFHASWEHEDFFLSAHKAGLKTVYCPECVVVHRGLMADPPEYNQARHRDDPGDARIMLNKWGFLGYDMPIVAFWGHDIVMANPGDLSRYYCDSCRSEWETDLIPIRCAFCKSPRWFRKV
jgi:GT2 family glycosyltransferase